MGPNEGAGEPRPRAQEIDGLLGAVTVFVSASSDLPQPDQLPQPIDLESDGEHHSLQDAEMVYQDGQLRLQVYGGGPSGPPRIARAFAGIGKPGRVRLANGDHIDMRDITVCGRGHLQTCEGRKAGLSLDCGAWKWLPQDRSSVLVGWMDGPESILGYNLSVPNGRGHLRLEGNLAWHLVSMRERVAAVAEVPLVEDVFERFNADLFAMEFVLGTGLGMSQLWAVDGEMNVVGGVGTYRSNRDTHDQRAPVPTKTPAHPCWSAPLFQRLSKHVHDQDSALDFVIAGYLDTLRGHIHGGYLLAQVALEAFCSESLPEKATSPLVRDVEVWKAWVAAQEVEVKKHARSEDDAGTLLNKLRGNVWQRPTGGAVRRAFRHWGIELPRPLLDEVARRNKSAHRFGMFDERSGDWEGAALRVEQIRTLLAAAIAKDVGYEGPLVGWERGEDGFIKSPDFWTDGDHREAHTRYVCRG